MRYYLIAGEASGDLHGSNLMKGIRQHDPDADFRFFGGDLMAEIQDNLVKHYREMAFMGIVNVLRNIKTIKRNMEFCKQDIKEFSPDALILIDYPGFNLKMAKFAKSIGIKVFYYISPKLWAWKKYRVKHVQAFVDEMFTILPFETEFYAQFNYPVHYVGNPLLDSKVEFEKDAPAQKDFIVRNGLNEKPIVALLAGSRKQEVRNMLPVMVQVAERFPSHQFVIAGAPSFDQKDYEVFLKGKTNIKVVFNQTYPLLKYSTAALVASGTATLETALFKVPQAVLYKVEGGILTEFIMRNFVFTFRFVGCIPFCMSPRINLSRFSAF